MHYTSRLLALCALAVLASGCDSPAPPQQKASNACPNWSSNPSHDYENTGFSNYGCAYYNNLSVQVADPDDLHVGRGDAHNSGEREDTVLDSYMKATQVTAPAASITSSVSAGR